MNSAMDEIMSRMGGGVDVGDPNQVLSEQFEDMRRDAHQVASMVSRALDNDAGREFVDWLMKRTILRPPTDLQSQATTVEEYALINARREGQNAVMIIILQALAVARGEEPMKGDDA